MLKLAPVFQAHLVLQRDLPIAVFGKADAPVWRRSPQAVRSA